MLVKIIFSKILCKFCHTFSRQPVVMDREDPNTLRKMHGDANSAARAPAETSSPRSPGAPRWWIMSGFHIKCFTPMYQTRGGTNVWFEEEMPAGMWFPTQLTALVPLTTRRSASHSIAGTGTDGPRLKWDREDMRVPGGAGQVPSGQGEQHGIKFAVTFYAVKNWKKNNS